MLWGRVCVSSLLQFGQVRGFNYQFNVVLSIRTTHFRDQFNNVINGRICPKLPPLTQSLLSVLFTRTGPTFTSLFGSTPINSLASHYQLPISNYPSRFAILRSLLFLTYWLWSGLPPEWPIEFDWRVPFGATARMRISLLATPTLAWLICLQEYNQTSHGFLAKQIPLTI